MAPTQDLVLILDYGSQFTQLIARRVREAKVYCEIVPFDANIEDLVARRPAGIILSGGPASVTATDAPGLSPELLQLGVPVLGICYGLQVLTRTLKEALALVDVGVNDHFIIAGATSPLSFAERGLL